MPSHYKKNKKKTMPKKHKTMGKKKTMKGRGLLSPAQLKKLSRPVRKFKTLPVKRKQKGMGCGCHHGQQGGNIFDSIGSAFKRTFSSLPRAALAVGTLGVSETFLQPLDLLKSTTGIKGSQILDVAAPIIGAVGTATGNPELALGSKLTSKALKQLGLGRRNTIMLR